MKIENVIYFLVLSVLLSGCQVRSDKQIKTLDTDSQEQIILIKKDDIEIEGDTGPFMTSLQSYEVEPGLQIITFSLHSGQPAIPSGITLKWKFPSVDIYSFWNPNINIDRVTYYANSVTSRATRYAPVVAYISADDNNRFTIACSDALNKVSVTTYLKEEDANIHCSVDLFAERMHAIKDYKLELRIDTRQLPYYKSIQGVSEWWAGMEDYEPSLVPESARMPLYSTWYSFHQNLDVSEVISECRKGKELGLEAVIVDDGWQTLDSQRGYAYTGDWEPLRIPEMRNFVDSIHALDMDFLLWYSVPFIGKDAHNYKRFRGKYLDYWESQGAYVLDPRYPEVREFIISTYEQAVKNWDLDGLKLDFLGWFAANEETDMTARDGRDFASVNIAVDRLMTDIMKRLRLLKPQIMIEFRQPYIGPLMRKYGNMFRAADCPNMAIVNRVRTTDIRLLCGNTAVHSDMLMWHENDPVENAALQILNILFTVPQLSVRLEKIPEDHLKMTSFWIDYWKKNKKVLLDGEFIPKDPESLYPLIKAKSKNKLIAVVYSDYLINIKERSVKSIDIVNAKRSETVVLDIQLPLEQVQFEITDCMGNVIEKGSKILEPGVVKFNVPPSGLLMIR